MVRLDSNHGVCIDHGLTRRGFLRAGGLALGLGLAELARPAKASAAAHAGAKACIQLLLVGGPSQLDTWDPKPGAPAEVRGPFRPIRTCVPSLHIGEHFPRMARMADRFAIIRSVYHKEAPVHETGQQLLQTGHLFHTGTEWPHSGAVLSKLRPAATGVPSWVLLPGAVESSGVALSNGQTAGFLGSQHGPLCAGQAFDLSVEPDAVRERYGWTPFGQNCLLARRLVQHGVRLVTVNMFDSFINRVTWDCHANGGDLNSSLADYRDTLCPMLDQAYTALLDDLHGLGLLQSTLVLCAGEFGRTPKVNPRGGRDHWPGVWSAVLAGGGVRGGQVIGASDAHGAEPQDRPVHASEIAATVYHALGIDVNTTLPGPDGQPVRLVQAEPVGELF